MSFTKETKKELFTRYSKARCCKLAELSALLTLTSKDGKLNLVYDDFEIANKILILMNDLFVCKIPLEKKIKNNRVGYELDLCEPDLLKKLSSMIISSENSGIALKEKCCKMAFLRGAFIFCGSISNPESSYNLEFIFKTEIFALKTQKTLEAFEIFAKIICRKKYYVIYLKDSEQISKVLNVIGAHKSLLRLEESKVLKDYRNKLNRQVNCETANSQKAVLASVKQVEDIELIINKLGADYLESSLYSLARLRLDNPYANMKQLGEMLDEPLSKSGVNHRFKKIKEIAEKIRKINE